jgi:hypothetical protein
MGQAKARGSKEKRVAEAVERARIAEVARLEQERADRITLEKGRKALQEARDKENADRLARGDKLLPERVMLKTGRKSGLYALLAASAIAMMASKR